LALFAANENEHLNVKEQQQQQQQQLPFYGTTRVSRVVPEVTEETLTHPPS